MLTSVAQRTDARQTRGGTEVNRMSLAEALYRCPRVRSPEVEDMHLEWIDSCSMVYLGAG
jgi:hypothetical protein